MTFLRILLSVVVILILSVIVGLQVKPRAFAPFQPSSRPAEEIPLPDGLPAPVERFFRTVYGDSIPVIETVVITGRARMRPFGIWLPARFIWIHNTGTDYRHYFEATLFGIPLLRIDEGYVDGKSFFESPMGTFYDDPNTNQGANLALWAEAGLFPAVWATDPRARWAPVDDDTALLTVPYEDKEETFVVRFDPETGLVTTLEVMRYREAGEGKPKILWITRNEPGPSVPDLPISAVGSVTWFDQGKPWAMFTLESIVTNVDVSQVIEARGTW